LEEIDEYKSINVFDFLSAFRKKSKNSTYSTVIGERVGEFRDRLDVVNGLKSEKDMVTGIEFVQPIESCSLFLMEELTKISYLRGDEEGMELMEPRGFVMTTVRSNFLTIKVNGHLNESTGVVFKDCLGVFYPYTEYAETKLDVCSFGNVLAYLDYIGVDRSMCSFEYHDVTNYVSNDDLLNNMSSIQQLVLFQSPNGNIDKTELGELTFNNFRCYQKVFEMKAFRSKSWQDSFEPDTGLSYKKWDIGKVNKLSATITF
jgi:hypothetical protein